MQRTRTDLQLGLEEELLGALRAVVDLVLLPVHREDVLLQLVGLHKDCTQTRCQGGPVGTPHTTHTGASACVDTAGHTTGCQVTVGSCPRGLEPGKLSSATYRLCNIGQVT